MELLKENLQLTEIKLTKKATVVCDTDCIVPDVKPDILKILQVDGASFITSKELTEGSCKINGKAKYTIFYLPDNSENIIEAIRTEQDFSCRIDMPANMENCIFDISSDIDRIDFSLLNSRKLAIKATVSLPHTIMERKSLNLAHGIDYERAETVYEPVMTENLQIFEEASFTVRDRLELPSGRASISEILKFDINMTNPETKAITGKAVLKGSLQLSVLYLDTDGVLNSLSGEIPFTEIAEIFDLNEDAPCNADYRITDYSFEPDIDMGGEASAVNFDISVSAIIASYTRYELQALTDCFCPGAKANMIYEHISFNKAVSNYCEQHTVKEIITPPENTPEINSVYNLFIKPVIRKCEPKRGAVNIEGTLEIFVSCITAAPQMPVFSFKHDIPLKLSIEDSNAKEGLSCIAGISVLHSSFNMNMANELELRAGLSVTAKLTEQTEIEIVSDCTLSEAPSESGIIIYFVQPDDTLWKIAKNYSVSIAELTEINSIDEPDKLEIGRKLIIPV